MAMKLENPKDIELSQEVPNKTLEKPNPNLTERLDTSPSSLPTLPSLEEPQKECEEEPKENKSPTPDAEMSPSPPVSDLQKKFRRAERFGMPVQLSEEEKRNSRSERFGGGESTLRVSDETKKSEELKRKARAERFGITSCSVADEEAKKKARSARFASGSKLDPLEEDKRKARAIRFSQTSATSTPSQTNGKADSDLKMATVDKVDGGV
ncbi:uncharacterized protein LOC143851399 [Tasmannia lanceolata]|uniref:uncharacterized protein LOC143851399 n=1 Tax=Tasmannia lanceolata TaxID=3420 RepID=UPI004062F1CA